MSFRKVNRGQRSQPVTLTAPIGGLNGRDELADMPSTDAFILDNWFPNNNTVDSRGGSSDHFTGVGAAVESLEVYAGGSTTKLLAFGNGKVYDASNAGVAGVTIATGRTSNKITSCMFSNAGAQYLLGTSGADKMFSYDGTTFANLTITGLTGVDTTLTNVFAFKGRVYLVQVNQLGFYYLAVGAIQGAASYFDLSQICTNGGYLVGIASFSADAGNGPADYIVFMTSEGEYLVYSGTDPSSAATFALVGRYYNSPPIGRKGWFNFRSELYIICEEGIIAFSEIRESGKDGREKAYLSAKLGRYLSDYMDNQSTHGWHGISYPRGNALIVNVPVGATTSDDYVQFLMNTDTGAWCRYTEWNALCFAVRDRRLYFGTASGEVVLADEGSKDNGVEIVCDARQAYNYFDDGKGMGASDKQFHYVSFIMQAEGAPAIACSLCVNFKDNEPDLTATGLDATGAQWDVSDWDTTDWGVSLSTQYLNVPLGVVGYVGSIWLRASTFGSSVKWLASRIVAEKLRGWVIPA